ncbi:M20/M25/M40 family metallo-hydrolase [Thermomonospora umbrina]|uniref:Aminopeptidase YwaD n=1 Tax=Thermomonospora umbrina TaxID=111806 RepID=A0A3D9T8T9_9ACTN|nr:M20/M25/M40 family metallo-hydrolase [Thermomonospora umbrina]REF00172.1 aminopeptidase YwaD [Thermomonospora umbrina]
MPEVRRRELLAGAAAFAGFAAAGFGPGTAAAATRRRPGASGAPALTMGDRAVVAKVDARRALRHLRVLSDDIGWRIAGTRGEHRAARYAAGVLRALGYDVALQPFPVADKYLAEMRARGVHWQCSASPQGALGAARGEVVDLGATTDVTEDVTGGLVLFTRVTGGETAQAKAAAAKGAAAVLIANVPPVAFPERKAAAFTPTLTENVSVPVLGVAQYHGERIRGGVRELSLEVTLHSGLTSYNVLAERRATLPNPEGREVIVSAHYDSVPGSPGANDDGSGTVLCLELARVLRRLPTQQTLRFALWGSEEYGLIGARHYVKELTDEHARRISGCFQNDMVATSHPPAGTYWLLSVDGADNTTTAAVAAAADRLGYRGQTKGPTARGSSDHEAFHERGIAAGNFSWRGGEAPSQLEPIYHTPEDTIAANISLQRLQVSLELIGCAAYDVARG